MNDETFIPVKAPRKKKLLIAASIVAAGAVLSLGVTGVVAANNAVTASSTSGAPNVANASSVTTGQADRAGRGGLSRILRAGFASGPDAGRRAQKMAAAIIAHPAVFAKLPAKLQADLTGLKNAAPADAAADAVKIRTTALAGGYGTQVQSVAQRLEDAVGHPRASALRTELRAAFNGNGAAAQKIAAALISHPKLFAKLPANLQTDLKALKGANAADATADTQKIKATALSGGYGPKIQKLAERLQGHAGAKSTSGPSTGASLNS